MMRKFVLTALMIELIASGAAWGAGAVSHAGIGMDGSPESMPAFVRIGERFGGPPVTYGTQMRPSSADVGNAIARDLKARFDAAADPSTHLLTKAAANRQGWGWATDHFDDIDQQKKGAVSFNDMLRYLNRQSVVPLPKT